MADKDVLAIIVGGGPAPGINGVISAVTIEALQQGIEVFGVATRPTLDPLDNLRLLARAGAKGFNFHDDDLVPFGTGWPETQRAGAAANPKMPPCSPPARTTAARLAPFRTARVRSKKVAAQAFWHLAWRALRLRQCSECFFREHKPLSDTEVLFYHLQNMLVENVLPPLLEKSLERGWRVVVQSTSPERADALDAHLWTYRDDSFLPHATWRVNDAADQPTVAIASISTKAPFGRPAA